MPVLTKAQLQAAIAAVFGNGTAATTAEFRSFETDMTDTMFDSSVGLNISGLTAETTLNLTNDYIAFYDNSAGANRKLAVGLIWKSFNGAVLTSATVATGDKVLIQDVSNSDNLKTVTVQSIVDLVGISGYQPLDATLTAWAAYNTNGLLTQTAADTFTGRTLTGTANQITVTNGNGVSGNPTLSLPSAITLPGSLTINAGSLEVDNLTIDYNTISGGAGGGGALTIDGTNGIDLKHSGSTKLAINSTNVTVISTLIVPTINNSGGVFIQHNGTTRIETTSAGITVTGAITLSGTFSNDVKLYQPTNDGNPQLRIGALDDEELNIQTVYDSGAQTLDYVLFQTDVASATANKGKYVFNVDGTNIIEINDSGLNNSTGFGLQYNGSTKLAIVTGGVTVTGTVDATTINNSAGVALQYNASTKLATTSVGVSVTGKVTISLGATITSGMLNIPTSGELTIAAGVITVTGSVHTIDTEADAATDDLDTINGGTDGDILFLSAENNGRDVVLKDGTGNMQLAGDFTMDGFRDFIMLRMKSSTWCEISRSNNN